MRSTRFMTWFFLALSLALFCVPNFRPVLEAPLAVFLPEFWSGEFGASAWAMDTARDLDDRTWRVDLLNLGTGRILDRFFTLQRYLTPAELLQRARDAEKSGNTELMAFAALHLPEKEMRSDVLQLTDRVVSINPKMTWLIYFVVARFAPESGPMPLAPDMLARVQKLEAWDPDNAVPHILHAYMIHINGVQNEGGAASSPSQISVMLAQRLEWQKEMETAFGKPRYDPYSIPRFEVERHVMVTEGWTNPVVMAGALGSSSPGLFTAFNYSKLLVGEMGKDAEAQGRIDDALRDYRTAARFGERLRLQGGTLIEDLAGMGIERTAYERLVPALNKAGKADEAAAVEFSRQQILKELDRRFTNPREQTSNRVWSVVLASILGTAVWVFLFLSLASILYVNAKRFIRRDQQGRLFQVMTALENYAPILLFASSLALGLVYAPYAQNFSSYMTLNAQGMSWENLLQNSFPMPIVLGRTDLPIENPYHGFVTYALVITALMAVIAIVSNRLAARK